MSGEPQQILFFGGTGTLGRRILDEVTARGHQATVIVRDKKTASIESKTNVRVEQGNIFDATTWSARLDHTDAVISAYGPQQGAEHKVVDATRSLLDAMSETPTARLIAVGGAGSLEVAPGLQLVDAPDFPEAYKAIALAHRQALDLYRSPQTKARWTNVSPPVLIEPGEKTGHYRVGQDTLVADDSGTSRISCEDFAVAIVDELENPKNVGRRFTVGY